MKTTCNVGTTDKIVRVVIGVISLWLAYAYSPWWLLLSIIMLVTAGMGWCPINKMLGINTCHIKTKHTKNDHVKEGGAQKTVTDTTSHEHASNDEPHDHTHHEGMTHEEHTENMDSGESKHEM